MTNDNHALLRLYSDYYDQVLSQFKPTEILPTAEGMALVPQFTADNITSKNTNPIYQFIENTIRSTPQLLNSDVVWREAFKEKMMEYIEKILGQCVPLMMEKQREEEMMATLANADEDSKQDLFQEMARTLIKKYEVAEFNVKGYQQLFTKGNTSAVCNAFLSDWQKAVEQSFIHKQQELIDGSEIAWLEGVNKDIEEDFEMRRKVREKILAYPELKEIIELMGRQYLNKHKKEDYLEQLYCPTLPSRPQPAAEAEEIIQGRELRHMLPVETAIMADAETEILFYHRYASRQLQLFANRPKDVSASKSEMKQRNKPALDKGPMIVGIDTSGSMYGEPEEIARGLLMQLVSVAKRQGRACFLISFSVHSKCINLSTHGSWSKVKDFLDTSFTGGNNEETMIKEALDALSQEEYSMADVLFISDFIFPTPLTSTIEAINKERANGTCFYGLQIGCYDSGYDNILDRIWQLRNVGYSWQDTKTEDFFD